MTWHSDYLSYARHQDDADPFHTHDAADEPRVIEISDSWSSVDPGLFWELRDRMLKDWAEALGVEVKDLPLDGTEAARALRTYGEEYKAEHGVFPSDYIQVKNDPQAWIHLARVNTGSNILPENFRVQNADGTFNFYKNTPSVGITPLIQATNVPDIDPSTFGGATEGEFRDRRANDPEARDALFAEGETPTDPFGKATMEQFLNRRNIPIVSPDELNRVLSPTTDDKATGRGSLAFDRDALNDSANNLWGRILWETAPNGLVDQYINEANAIFKSTGAQKGFESWAMSRMRSTAKYGVMYGRMEPGFTELEWQARFDTSQFGLRLEDERAQSIRGLSSAAAPASFQQSVEQSRDVQSVGQGRFSQRFANHINQLGRLQNR